MAVHWIPPKGAPPVPCEPSASPLSTVSGAVQGVTCPVCRAAIVKWDSRWRPSAVVDFPRITGSVLLALGLAWGSIGAAEVRVDEPDRWSEPSASHHGKHFLGGIPLGVGAYAMTSLGDIPIGDRFITAAAAGAIVGVGFEVVRGWDGSSYIDPVDAAWVVVGSIAGAGLAHLTGSAVSLAARPGQASVTVAWRF